MAKRFTDTSIWDKEWFMELSPKLKCLVRYLFDNCDQAGVWSPNWKLASLHIGEKVSSHDLKEIPADQWEWFNDKIFLPDFIKFQSGTLSKNCAPHKPIFVLIEKHGLQERVFNRVSERVSNNLQEKEKVKEEEIEKEKVKEEGTFGKYENLLVPEMSAIFVKANPNYPANKIKDSQSLFSIAKFLAETGKLNGSPDLHKDRIIEAWEQVAAWISKDNFYGQKSLTTISNHIQEIVQKLLHGKSVNGKSQPGSNNRAKEFDDLFAKSYRNGRSATG